MTDDGKPVELTLFSNASQPFTAVVMLDTSASMTSNLEFLNRAAEQFLIRMLPVDKAQVGAFNDKIQFSGRFTNNRDELIDALDEMQFGNPTRLNDAIGASLDALQGVDGRRVVLVFTDGEDTSSRTGFRTVLERARNEEVMVYTIGLESEMMLGNRIQRTRPSRDLRKIADETGGGSFELKKTDQLASDVHARGAGTAQPVLAGIRAGDAGRQGAQTRRADEERQSHRSRPPELPGNAGSQSDVAVATVLMMNGRWLASGARPASEPIQARSLIPALRCLA